MSPRRSQLLRRFRGRRMGTLAEGAGDGKAPGALEVVGLLFFFLEVQTLFLFCGGVWKRKKIEEKY